LIFEIAITIAIEVDIAKNNINFNFKKVIFQIQKSMANSFGVY
jgi:hypothetical protein